jgi:hypothetical protein
VTGGHRAVVAEPLAQLASSEVGRDLARAWHEYERGARRRRLESAIGGLLWATAWTVVAVMTWRSGSASQYAPSLQLLALVGWFAVLPLLRGTIAALLIRFALMGACAGLLIVLLRSSASTGSSMAAGIALALPLTALAYRGLIAEMRARHPQPWTLRADGERYLMAVDTDAFRWFVSRDECVAVLASTGKAAQLMLRLSAPDRVRVRVLCSDCDRELAAGAEKFAACHGDDVLLLYAPTPGP